MKLGVRISVAPRLRITIDRRGTVEAVQPRRSKEFTPLRPHVLTHLRTWARTSFAISHLTTNVGPWPRINVGGDGFGRKQPFWSNACPNGIREILEVPGAARASLCFRISREVGPSRPTGTMRYVSTVVRTYARAPLRTS